MTIKLIPIENETPYYHVIFSYMIGDANGNTTYDFICNESEIERLNKIFKETGCKLIVSSSWRFDSDLKELFKMVGISNEIFGITGISQTRYRGFEIQNYLDAQKNVLSYCILDDDCDMLPTQLDNFIQTDFRVGLTEDNVNKAIKILNRYDEH